MRASIVFGFAPLSFVLQVALAESLFLLLLFSIRLYQGQRMARRTLARAALAVLLIAAVGFSWLLIAAAVTGERGAYFPTELAWWRFHVGEVTFVPFTPWFLMADRYGGWAGAVAVAVLMVAVGLALVSAPSSELPRAPRVRRAPCNHRCPAHPTSR